MIFDFLFSFFLFVSYRGYRVLFSFFYMKKGFLLKTNKQTKVSKDTKKKEMKRTRHQNRNHREDDEPPTRRRHQQEEEEEEVQQRVIRMPFENLFEMLVNADAMPMVRRVIIVNEDGIRYLPIGVSRKPPPVCWAVIKEKKENHCGHYHTCSFQTNDWDPLELAKLVPASHLQSGERLHARTFCRMCVDSYNDTRKLHHFATYESMLWRRLWVVARAWQLNKGTNTKDDKDRPHLGMLPPSVAYHVHAYLLKSLMEPKIEFYQCQAQRDQ